MSLVGKCCMRSKTNECRKITAWNEIATKEEGDEEGLCSVAAAENRN